jgi:hypothetical protein
MQWAAARSGAGAIEMSASRWPGVEGMGREAIVRAAASA